MFCFVCLFQSCADVYLSLESFQSMTELEKLRMLLKKVSKIIISFIIFIWRHGAAVVSLLDLISEGEGCWWWPNLCHLVLLCLW